MILVVDHYDSFTYNLVQLIESLGRATEVVKSDAEPADGARGDEARGRRSCRPGPGHPRTRGASRSCSGSCRRDDAGAGRVPRAPGDRRSRRRHGGPHRRRCTGRRRSCTTRAAASSTASPIPFEAGRYHSLVVAARRAARRAGADGVDRGRARDGDPAPRRSRGSACSSTPRASSPPRARGSSRTSSSWSDPLRRPDSRARTANAAAVARDPARRARRRRRTPAPGSASAGPRTRTSSAGRPCPGSTSRCRCRPRSGRSASSRRSDDPRVGAEAATRRSSPCSRNRAPIGGHRRSLRPGLRAALARCSASWVQSTVNRIA